MQRTRRRPARGPGPRPRPGGRAAQAWPGKTIRIVVPYTPGGSSDIIARSIAHAARRGAEDDRDRREQARRQRQHRHRLRRQVARRRLHAAALRRRRAGDHAPRSTRSCRSIRKKDLRGVTMLAYSPHLLVVHPSVQAEQPQGAGRAVAERPSSTSPSPRSAARRTSPASRSRRRPARSGSTSRTRAARRRSATPSPARPRC